MSGSDSTERRRAQSRAKAARYRARKRGEAVPRLKPGPAKGYKQTPEHVAKRKRFGTDHHAWVGDAATKETGRGRALRAYPDAQPCEACGYEHVERHHLDGNTLNNEPENIGWLCRRCHMEADGRLDEFIKLAKANQPTACAARWN